MYGMQYTYISPVYYQIPIEKCKYSIVIALARTNDKIVFHIIASIYLKQNLMLIEFYYFFLNGKTNDRFILNSS